MHTGKRYSPWEFARWTLRGTLLLLLLATIPTILHVFGWHFLSIPWQPVAVLGTALAFIVGFKNNASYGRLWEARQIYGAIINDSRSFAFTLRDAIRSEPNEKLRFFFNRHFAWLTALRFQLREPRSWENTERKENQEYLKGRYIIPEWESSLDKELAEYLGEEELNYILSKKNRATQIIALQSKNIAILREEGVIGDIQWMELQNSISRLIDNQGKAERIKNFPYPRNFASVTTYLMYVFVVLLPFGLLKEYNNLGSGTFLDGYTIWFNIPISATVAWAFYVLDTIGESSVNPFEGSANDIPITQISRMLEIDLLDMLDEQDLPDAIVAKNNILM